MQDSNPEHVGASGFSAEPVRRCGEPVNQGKARILNGRWQGYIVLLNEGYPGLHTMRLPGGAPIFPETMRLEWERVPEDTPLATRASARREKARRRWGQGVQNRLRQTLRL